MNGIPLPYLMHSDWMITLILFGCLIMVSYALTHIKKFLFLQFRFFITSRERASMFDDATSGDVHYTLLLLLNSFIMQGFCNYYYFSETRPLLFYKISHLFLLILFVLLPILLFVLKWIAYQWVNWVFFSRGRNIVWMASYLHISVWVGLLLLPVVLLTVYFDLNLYFSLILMGLVFVLAKIMLFYKAFYNFFPKLYGFLHLILYFCTLEILPDLLVWRGIELMNEYFILNF